jgi:hypothetical protein
VFRTKTGELSARAEEISLSIFWGTAECHKT